MIDTISQMERSISILDKQMKGGASLAQMPNSVRDNALAVQAQRSAALAEAFSAMIDSSSIDSADSERLASFIQSSNGDSDSEADSSADSESAELDEATETFKKGGPANAGSIVETLQNLLEKAQTQLENARTKETKSRFNFELFSQSLQRKIAQAQKDMNDAKKAMGLAGQTKAKAEGDIEHTKKDLGEDHKALNDLHHECMNKATDFEDETKSMGEELKALAQAKKVIKEMTGAAEEKTYGAEEGEGDFAQVSFLQSQSSSEGSPSMRAARAVRALGKKQNMPALLDIAHKMDTIIRDSAVSGGDPFQKVKIMITTMKSMLEHQMEAEASHKAYCDKEMADTTKSKNVKESLVDKLTTKVDSQTSEAMNGREHIVVLQKELLAIMKTQEEVDHLRKGEHARYQTAKPELEQGESGIKKALQVLREYYSQDEEKSLLQVERKQEGAGATIIGILEVVESDFSKAIANLQEMEESAQAQYLKQTQENEVTKAIKQQDVIHLTKEVKSLGKSTSETSTDLDGVQTELDAVNEYYAKIQSECVAKPEPYEERRKRQEATLQGLQDAQQVLGGGAALAQQNARHLRGVMPHEQQGEQSDDA